MWFAADQQRIDRSNPALARVALWEYYPLVRESLRRHAGDRYLAPSHWRALLTLYQTPRHYVTYDELMNPLTGHRLSLDAVEARLRSAPPLPSDR